MRLLAACLLVVCLAAGSGGANGDGSEAASRPTYWVDWNNGDDATGDGSRANPWKSLNRGVQALGPGKTLMVRSGTYQEMLLNVIPSGTSWDRAVSIRWDAQGTKPIIEAPAPEPGKDSDCIDVDGQYIIIEGLDCDARNANAGCIGISGNHIRFQDCIFRNSPTQGVLGGGEYFEFIRCKFHDNGTKPYYGVTEEDIRNGPYHGYHHGIYLSGKNNLVDGCEAYNNKDGYGFHLYPDPERCVVRNCVAYGNYSAGIVVCGGRDNEIYDNVCYGNDVGVTVWSEGTAAYRNACYDNNTGIAMSSGALIYSNVCYRNKTGIAVRSDGSRNAIYNNTVHAATPSETVGVYLSGPDQWGPGASDCRVLSNIVWNCGTPIDDHATSTVNEYNLTSDPSFVDVSRRDLRLNAGSAAIDAGPGLKEVVTDKDGRLRPQGNGWDIGAYEYCAGQQRSSGPGATYWVDWDNGDDATGDGSQASPWKSLNRGVQALGPGTTLMVRSGTYQEWLYENIPSGASWDEAVTIQWDGIGEKPVIEPPTPEPGQEVDCLDIDGHYIIIDGLDCNAINASTGCMGVEASSHHVRFENCIFRNSPSSGAGSGGSYIEFINCKFVGNGRHPYWGGPEDVAGGPYKGFHHGIYLTGEHNVIDGCEFCDNLDGFGVHFHPASHSVVRNSVVHHNFAGGIILTGGNNEAYNNVCYDHTTSWGAGIVAGASDRVYGNTCYSNTVGIHVCDGGTYYNNVCHDNTLGMKVRDDCSRARILNNTLVRSTPNDSVGIYLSGPHDYGPGATGVSIYNNIIYNFGTAIEDHGAKTLVDRNLTTDPLFVNGALCDFRLVPASAAIDAGMKLGEVSTDKAGRPRPQGKEWDIGAYEYQAGPGSR